MFELAEQNISESVIVLNVYTQKVMKHTVLKTFQAVLLLANYPDESEFLVKTSYLVINLPFNMQIYSMQYLFIGCHLI